MTKAKRLKMSDVPDIEEAYRAINALERTLHGSTFTIFWNGQDDHFETTVFGNSDEMRTAMEPVNKRFVTELKDAMRRYRQSVVDYLEKEIGVEWDYEFEGEEK